jgi:His/Glu/Gln/Arg/opine family amino acid ABC transporter permease subunit
MCRSHSRGWGCFRVLALGGALVLAGCGGAGGEQDHSLERVQRAGKLLVAVDPTYPPMEFTGADGRPRGFDIDFAEGLAARLGVRAEFVVMDWSGIVAGLQSGRYDAVIIKSGQAEVAVTDEPVGHYYAGRDRAFVVTGQALEPEAVGIALRKGDRELQKAIAAAVEGLKRDGSFRRLEEQWFGAALGHHLPAGPRFWAFSWSVVLPRVLRGMALTVQLTLGGGCCGIALGLLLALARLCRRRLAVGTVVTYVTVFRGTPLLLQILFVYFALPVLLGVRLEAFVSALLALSLNTAAYVSEIMRAAIQSIDRGQMEAARALGMSYGQAMRRIILPQTYRRMLPPLVNELAALSKDTSLVMVIALPELLYEPQRLAASYLRPWEVYAWAALGYLVMVLVLSALAGLLEKRLASREA